MFNLNVLLSWKQIAITFNILSNKYITCNKRAVQAETSPASCYFLKMAHKLKNGKNHSGKEFRFVMEPLWITKGLNLLTHQLRLIHKLYCWNLMMVFHFITFYLQYVHYFLGFMKVRDQGLYLHSQSTRPCFVAWTRPRSNKQTNKQKHHVCWLVQQEKESELTRTVIRCTEWHICK